jgi:DNA end-binding protein Ku
MAPPRPYWKGHLKLSLVSCPVAIYTATSSGERVSFRQINKKTGHRLRQQLVDDETGDAVDAADKGRGYEIAKNTFLPVEDSDFDGIAIESNHTIDIDTFVPRADIDERYLDSPYYLVPDDRAGQDAYAVIREAMRGKDMVALGRVVLAKRERVMMLQAWDKGLLGTTLRYAYEIKDSASVFDGIPDVAIAPDMRKLAEHILDSKAAAFDPSTFRDRYEEAVVQMLETKRAGAPAAFQRKAPAAGGNVVDLMDALKRSLAGTPKPTEVIKPKKARKRIAGQGEMLLPIAGKGPPKVIKAKETTPEAKKPVKPASSRRAG